MGSWTESCALSGLEIRRGDACVLLIIEKEPVEFFGHEILKEPIHGVYDDAGGLQVTRSCLKPKLEVGDWFGSQRVRSNRIAWIHGCIASRLETLPCPGEARSIGAHVDERITRIRDILATLPERKEDVGDGWVPSTRDDLLAMMSIQKIVHDQLVFAQGYDFIAAKRSCDPDAVERLLDRCREGWIIKTAEVALRRKISPDIPRPQDGGLEAARAFARMTLEAAEAMLGHEMEAPGHDN
ncbi:hypothetical protein LAZ40_03175 [Cereibacter sphaeroides]|uniref:hypothetical protein n=1 Tax=Cereibacter sphaeroides TaxID=1063 RepID=UPI001F1879F1|nr:hypothetical protein [Cereibacter sphaeroides]MCE6958057.1 hypothetical protein [Cereibacter sphaeroides]MCE6971350.1 hypothetical protein [Cereibacter sphaeroides]